MRRLEIDYNLGVMDSLVSLARYNFVNRVIQNKNMKVLDFGCGTGYGTKVLKESFKEVDAFDVVDEKDLGISEERGIITDFSKLKVKHYDVVTCFEVIEHLDEKTQIELMQRLHNHLNENGTLFISTVRKMDPPPTENRRIEHIRELSFNELLDY
jgi:2-polyprenyl-3-methyl-5-hydroxy-6-metoxy-1,4-benzoquinol methylase